MSERAKVILFTVLITILCILGSRSALAADYSIRGGPGLMDGRPTGTAKYFGIRKEDEGSLGSALELGGFVDRAGGGRKSSAVLRYQLGAKPGPEVGTFAKAYTGPCVISSPDSMLGGRFPQFCTDLAFGIRDRMSLVTVGYSHISSAGLCKPNKGRDFVLLEMGVRW